MKAIYKQCNLKSSNSVMTAWLEADKVRAGIKVTLKDSQDPARWWLITSVGDTALPKDEIKGSHASEDWYKKDFRGTLKGLKIK